MKNIISETIGRVIGRMTVAATLTVLLTVRISSQVSGGELNSMQIDGQRVQGQDVHAIFCNLAKIYRVPIGFISVDKQIPNMSMRSRGTFRYFPSENNITPRDGSLANIMNELTTPTYRWNFENGIILVYPANGIGLNVQRFLRIPLEDAQLFFEPDLARSSARIIRIPLTQTKKLQPSSVLGLESQPSERGEPVRTISVHNMNVIEVLNASIKESAYNCWNVFDSPNDGIVIDLR